MSFWFDCQGSGVAILVHTAESPSDLRCSINQTKNGTYQRTVLTSKINYAPLGESL